MRRVITLLTLGVLISVLALGGLWASFKKPWLMDDFRSGYTAGKEGDLPDKGHEGCAKAMADLYDTEPSYVQWDTPEEPSAFYLGCERGLAGLTNDWWNASGYLTA
jgi:hypothetical protein